jgi:DNA-binding transcriptional regulator YdaS (Cro superfamily)
VVSIVRLTQAKIGLTVRTNFPDDGSMTYDPTALNRAIGCFDSQLEFAAALSRTSGRPVTSQAISQWKANGVPEDRCEPIETITDHKVRVEEVRPDIQWQRNGDGQVIGFLPAPRAIQPTSRKRTKRRA